MNEPWTTFPISLTAGVISGVVIFLVGVFWPVIPKSYRQFHLRRFWGKGVLSEGIVITYGGFVDSRVINGNARELRYVKEFHDGRRVKFVGPWGNVVADAEIRSASYIIATLSRYRKKPVPVAVDAIAFSNLNRTLVALGSPSSNELTGLILREPNNTFLEFRQIGKETLIYDKTTHREFRGFQEPVRRDLGIILKIPNLRFPGTYFFVCAGLGEWGTSGAAWYLATKWRDLESEFNHAFGVIVEIELGSDESARRVFP